MRTRLQTIIAARLVVSTLLLGTAIAIDLARPETFPVNPFALLIGLTFALSFVYVATLGLVERWPWYLDLQFAADAVLVSAFIHVTGGINSHFSSLYVLPIIAASTARSRSGALQVASLSATLYTGIVAAQYLDVGVVPAGWWMPPVSSDLPEPGFAKYTVAINLAGMFAVALLAGALAERLLSAKAGLRDASDQIADLLTFNDHLIDSLSSGVVTTDDRGRILTFNRGAARITGLLPQAACGADVRDVLQLPADALPPLAADGVRRRLETTFDTREGRAAEIGLTAAVLQYPEGTSGYLLTFQDITDLKRLERESRLQQRRAAVGEMAAGIAHEIRNPLAAMTGSLEVLRQELPLTEEQAQLLDIALRESEHLNERIQLFLAYTRPEPAAVAQVDVRAALERTAAVLHKSVDARPRHLVVVDAPTSVAWRGDEADVRQILWSLGTNGLRAMPDGGHLILSARVEPTVAGTAGEGCGGGRELLLTVQDSGAGDHGGRVGDGREPLPGSLPRGAGLGLAVVHRIATDYGGRVEVSSVLGVGTTVSVRLPEVVGPAREELHAAEAERRTA